MNEFVNTVGILMIIFGGVAVVALVMFLRAGRVQTKKQTLNDLHSQLEAARHALFLIRRELIFAHEAQQPINEEAVETALDGFTDTVALTLKRNEMRQHA